MSNLLEEALRAAKANASKRNKEVGSVNGTTQESNKSSHRKRQRVESDGVEAFHHHVVEKYHTPQSTHTSKDGDEGITVVQWKGKKKKGKRKPIAETTKDDDIQLLSLTKIHEVKHVVESKNAILPIVISHKHERKNKIKAKNKHNKMIVTPTVSSAAPVPDLPTQLKHEDQSLNSTSAVNQAHETQNKSKKKKKKTRKQATVTNVTENENKSRPVQDDNNGTQNVESQESKVKGITLSTVNENKQTQRQHVEPVAVVTKSRKKRKRQQNHLNLLMKGEEIVSNRQAIQEKTDDVKNLNQTATPPSISLKQCISKPEPVNSTSSDEKKWDLNALMASTLQQKPKKNRYGHKSINYDSTDDSDESLSSNDDNFDSKGRTLSSKVCSIYSKLIDEAAREQWELVEVGRLVRLFTAQWRHRSSPTATFLRDQCPELVSVDFLEGLSIQLSTKSLLDIFINGSGTIGVLLNKISNSLENGYLKVDDEELLKFITDRTLKMTTHEDILDFLMPLFEGLSKVKHVGVLLRHVTQHWHVTKTCALVQQVLLTSIFDDLDGRSDELFIALPELKGLLDFPTRMDAEDADENGNLKDLVVGDDSEAELEIEEMDMAEKEQVEAEEALEEIGSDAVDEDDSHAEDSVYDGETDSEEEEMFRRQLEISKSNSPRRRSRFVLDEADEADEDEDESEVGFLVDDDIEDDSDNEQGLPSSDDEKEIERPRSRKRLRQS